MLLQKFFNFSIQFILFVKLRPAPVSIINLIEQVVYQLGKRQTMINPKDSR